MITILIEANSPGIPCCRRQGQLRNMTSSYHEGILLASLRPTRLWNTVTVLLQNPSDSCIILRPCVLHTTDMQAFSYNPPRVAAS